jgi:hypothetical protein
MKGYTVLSQEKKSLAQMERDYNIAAIKVINNALSYFSVSRKVVVPFKSVVPQKVHLCHSLIE